MQITKLKQRIKNKGSFNIYVDNKFCCTVSSDTVVRCNLYEGKEINDEELKRMKTEELYFYLIRKALDYIQVRYRSTREIYIHLNKHIRKRKNIDLVDKDIEEIKAKILAKLKEYELFNDYKFSRDLIRSKISKWKYSKKEIEVKLRHYGIKKSIYETILNKMYTNEVEQDTIQALIKKKKKQGTTKLINYLLNKGFNYSNIKKLIYIL